jgi:hypothetical protein
MITTGTRTAEQIATEALGEQIDALNWTCDGECQLENFDDAVLEAAVRVRHTLSPDEVELMNAHVGDSVLYYSTLETLRRRSGGRNFVTAQVIVAMYWQMETRGLDED